MKDEKKFKEVTINEDEFVRLTAKTAAELSNNLNLGARDDYRFMIFTATFSSRLANILFYGR